MKFTKDENIMLCLYGKDTRRATISALCDMRGELLPHETALKDLTDSVLAKLRAMTDEEFSSYDVDILCALEKTLGTEVSV